MKQGLLSVKVADGQGRARALVEVGPELSAPTYQLAKSPEPDTETQG